MTPTTLDKLRRHFRFPGEASFNEELLIRNNLGDVIEWLCREIDDIKETSHAQEVKLDKVSTDIRDLEDDGL